jgi:hypothetical protein
MPVLLTPSKYPCPTHPQIDLTDEVLQEVEALPTKVATFGFRPLRSRRNRSKNFEVIVTCEAESPAHKVVFHGSSVVC